MKNATRYCAGPAYYRMCSTDVYCSKQTGKENRRKPSPIISSFLELGRRKLSMAKICGGAENVVKTETQQTFVNGLLGFHYFRAFILRWKRVYGFNIKGVAHRYGQLYLHCSLIYFWVPSSAVLQDQPL